MSVGAGRPAAWLLTRRVSGLATAARLTPLGWMPGGPPPAVGQECQGRSQPRLWHFLKETAARASCLRSRPRARPEVVAGRPRDALVASRGRCRVTPGCARPRLRRARDPAPECGSSAFWKPCARRAPVPAGRWAPEPSHLLHDARARQPHRARSRLNGRTLVAIRSAPRRQHPSIGAQPRGRCCLFQKTGSSTSSGRRAARHAQTPLGPRLGRTTRLPGWEPRLRRPGQGGQATTPPRVAP